MSMLHCAAYFAHWITGQDAHQNCACRFASARTADEQAFAPGRECQQREQDEAGVTLSGGERQRSFAVSNRICLRRSIVVLDIVVRADDRIVHDPEVSLPKFFIEGLISFLDRGARLNWSLIQVCNVELTSLRRGFRIGGSLGYALKNVERCHRFVLYRVLGLLIGKIAVPLASLTALTSFLARIQDPAGVQQESPGREPWVQGPDCKEP